jgi:hypothetical protein
MAIINIVVLGLPNLVLGMNSLLGSMPLNNPTESLCAGWAIVEQLTYISTCFALSTIATIDGYMITIPNITYIAVIITFL